MPGSHRIGLLASRVHGAQVGGAGVGDLALYRRPYLGGDGGDAGLVGQIGRSGRRDQPSFHDRGLGPAPVEEDGRHGCVPRASWRTAAAFSVIQYVTSPGAERHEPDMQLHF
ncbi:hypothetical protein NX794_20080 [Streptomyces sp. LP11]|uniref:Uncharacterized protein n=1 Tax=Streptomyces pyxinicus TaxID=2970331 RepID=A0ABT2B565_9ACTN|nr:hypothetical protein [Streptomyces sp. LP11]MCS0603496.1 hypothetical protein [Streptomyces sp. LP11]